jgi:hypothetical protein
VENQPELKSEHSVDGPVRQLPLQKLPIMA